MPTKTRDPDYSAEKRNNISEEISHLKRIFGIMFCTRYTYLCVFLMSIEFYNYLHDST